MASAKYSLKLTSSAFENMHKIPKKYSYEGENINPPLEISGIPKETQSLVLIMDAPDAPTQVWSHWIVCNINPKTTLIKKGQFPLAQN